MSILVGDNFSYSAAKPLDGRLKYDTLADMKAVADATMYDGCTAYCKEADKTYQWKSTNTVDENTGKWREFSSGGSTGGGHTIEDSEGTDLTQRDTLQFGEGFKAEDDSTNEKTVISPDVMQSGDMDDVITPLPSVAPKKEGVVYSTTEQMIGEWTDGKPLYQKNITGTAPSSSTTQNIQIGSNIENALVVGGYCKHESFLTPINIQIDANEYFLAWIRDNTNPNSPNTVGVKVGSSLYSGNYNIIIQYTKTTD